MLCFIQTFFRATREFLYFWLFQRHLAGQRSKWIVGTNCLICRFCEIVPHGSHPIQQAEVL